MDPIESPSSRPYVTVHYAQSTDGRIATASGDSQWISGNSSLDFAHALRRDNQAVLVGIGTVLKDDPMLTCRLPGTLSSPVRVVIDSQLRIPGSSALVSTAADYRILIFCHSSAPEERRVFLEKRGIEVFTAPQEREGRLDLPSVLGTLGSLGFRTLLVEGGSNIITSLFAHTLVDRLFITTAPIILGKGIPAVGDLGITRLNDGIRGSTVSVNRYDNDVVSEIIFHEKSEKSTEFQARVVSFEAPGVVSIREKTLSSTPGEILVESRIIGISHGTERHIYEGSFPSGPSMDGLSSLAGKMEYPLEYGYMNAGEVSDGTRVFAFFPHQNRFYISADQLIRFPEDTEFEDIVLFPSMETAYNIVLDTAPLPGEKILVIGQGMIGLLTVEILKTQTGIDTAALEKDRYRVNRSRELGIRCEDPEGLTGNELQKQARQMFEGNMPDKVIHLSGTADGLQAAIDSCGFEGRIIDGSWYGSDRVSLSLGENFHRNRLTLTASQVTHVPGHLHPRWNRSRRTDVVRDLIQRIRPSKFITHRYLFSEAERAFKDISDGREGLLQAVLLPDT